ncbi:MAG: hypothetical protein HRU19_17715 [Pseudobacteriovorax sp.]|nr:hypothetical protein [Pseudobacteriovorax sp.]
MQTENNENKVVSLFDRSETKEKPAKKQADSEGYDFEAIMKQNAENKGRLGRDRKKSNRGVIRSYRLKH